MNPIPVVVLLLSVSQTEKNPVQEAKKYFEAGKQAYASSLYGSAARAFERANELAPNSAIVFSIAQAYRLEYLTGRDPANLEKAIEFYRLYLQKVRKGGRRKDAIEHLDGLLTRAGNLPETSAATVPDPTQLMISSGTKGAMVAVDGADAVEVPVTVDVKPGEHLVVVEAPGFYRRERKATAVEGRLIVVEANLTPKPAKVTVSAPNGSNVALDGRPMGTAPLPRALDVGAGYHFIAVTDAGMEPFTKSLELKRGEEVSLVASLETTTQRHVSYYFLGAGGVVLTITGVIVGAALANEAAARIIIRKRDIEGKNLSETERDDYIKTRSTRNDLLAVSSVGAVLGGIVIGIGAVLYLSDAPSVVTPPPIPIATSESGEISSSVAPMVGPGTLGAQLVGQF